MLELQSPTEFPPIESLLPQLPDLEKPPAILTLIRSRDTYIEDQISRALTATVVTKKCACLNCGGIGWILCKRTSETTIMYQAFVHWGTDLTVDIPESSLLVYQMNAEILAECELKDGATHISYITAERDRVTIFIDDKPLSLYKKVA